MEEIAAELRGRMAAAETVMITMLAHIAAHTDKPVQFTAQIMDNAEKNLRAAREAAQPGDIKDADYALASFEHFSAAMLAHVTRITAPRGHG